MCWDVAQHTNRSSKAAKGAGAGPLHPASNLLHSCLTAGTATHLSCLVGNGAFGDGVIDVEADCDAFAVQPGVAEPASLLFDPVQQQRRVVFRTKPPVLTREECRNVVAICDAYAASNGGWGTVRHSSVRTSCFGGFFFKEETGVATLRFTEVILSILLSFLS